MLSINLTGYFLCAQVFGRAMLDKRDGAMVHVASVMSDFPSQGGRADAVAPAGCAAVPLGGIGLPADLAQAVLFLVSPRASYVNGRVARRRRLRQQNLMSLVSRPAPPGKN